jgi:uncharacterized membrane protein
MRLPRPASVAGDSWDDARLEQLLGAVLRWGVMVAASVVAAGGAVFLVRHGGERPLYHMFRGEPSGLRAIPGIVGGTLEGSGRALIQFGVLLLIGTPVLRVVSSLGVFALQRDWRYVLISLAVLAVLLYGLLGPYL